MQDYIPRKLSICAIAGGSVQQKNKFAPFPRHHGFWEHLQTGYHSWAKIVLHFRSSHQKEEKDPSICHAHWRSSPLNGWHVVHFQESVSTFIIISSRLHKTNQTSPGPTRLWWTWAPQGQVARKKATGVNLIEVQKFMESLQSKNFLKIICLFTETRFVA